MGYFEYVTSKRNDNQQLISLMEKVALSLNKESETGESVSLVGLIQSGKTRTFIGAMAKCFDLGFDAVILFTKVSKALVQQTINRLDEEFKVPLENGHLLTWNAIKLDEEALDSYMLASKKNIFVTKKEKANLNKLHELIDGKLRGKKILIVDDEADANSVTYIGQDELAVISTSLSDLRNKAKGKCAYLQVTATPYSLYLQPPSEKFNRLGYSPLNPKQTFLLEPHSSYIGGKYYFEDSEDENSPAYYLYHEITQKEMDYLNKKSKTTQTYNKRLLANVLTSDYIPGLRDAIYLFLVGGAIRYISEQNTHIYEPFAKEYKCAFLMHTSQTKTIHKMQKDMVQTILEALTSIPKNQLEEILTPAIENLNASILASGKFLPSNNEIIDFIYNIMQNHGVKLVEVNSDSDINNQLGKDGQLRLDSPYNIFIGGQSLDRGITIDHLIGAFYGRDPKRVQMDTVLQHSRMYGARSPEDLSVTRFSTTERIYKLMKKMHFFDKDLRDLLRKGAPIKFIAKQGNEIIPCGPQKLMASTMCQFKAGSRLLPTGFQTKCKTTISKSIIAIDKAIENATLLQDCENYQIHKMTVSEITEILQSINNTFAYEEKYDNIGLEWELDAHLTALEHTANEDKEVLIYSNKTRKLISRKKKAGYTDAPDDGKTDTPTCQELAQDTPVVMLLKVDGITEKGKGGVNRGWNGTDFYWPVIVMPESCNNYVYTPDTINQ